MTSHRDITIPLPCSVHPRYGGKKAPTSGCNECQIFYEDRAKAVEDIKAALRLLDKYGALQVVEDDDLRAVTPEWMDRGRTMLPERAPNRQRHIDGIIRYSRLYYSVKLQPASS